MQPDFLHQRMPDHALSCILHRLDLRSFAACRLVCRSWRCRIDDSRVLEAARTSWHLYAMLTGGQAWKVAIQRGLVSSELEERVVTSEDEPVSILEDLKAAFGCVSSHTLNYPS